MLSATFDTANISSLTGVHKLAVRPLSSHNVDEWTSGLKKVAHPNANLPFVEVLMHAGHREVAMVDRLRTYVDVSNDDDFSAFSMQDPYSFPKQAVEVRLSVCQLL